MRQPHPPGQPARGPLARTRSPECGRHKWAILLATQVARLQIDKSDQFEGAHFVVYALAGGVVNAQFCASTMLTLSRSTGHPSGWTRQLQARWPPSQSLASSHSRPVHPSVPLPFKGWSLKAA